MYFEILSERVKAVDGNMPEYWTELFGKLGRPVPEGEPGTNPNGMSKSSLLEQVHRYF